MSTGYPVLVTSSPQENDIYPHTAIPLTLLPFISRRLHFAF
jgi:hypothetical protein